MATQYVLAKREYFNSLIGGPQPTLNPPPSSMIPTAETRLIATQEDKIKESVADIINLMPKTYRSRAGALLKMLESKLVIGDMGMLVLRHQGQEFENLYDLVFWLFTSTNIVRVQRPTNAFDFIRALVDLKIPQRLLSTKELYVRKVQKSLKKYTKSRK